MTKDKGTTYSFYLNDSDIDLLEKILNLKQQKDPTLRRLTHSRLLKEGIVLLHDHYFPNKKNSQKNENIKEIKAPPIPPLKPHWFINEDGQQEFFDPEDINKHVKAISGINEELLGKIEKD